MKQLTTAKGTFGPFTSITVHADHYEVSGCIFPFTVYGSGGVVSDAPPSTPAPIPPTAVTMRQARLALLGAGLLANVNAAVAAMEGVQGEAARIEWEYATEVQRGSQLVAGLAGALGLTESALDGLFLAAAAL